MKRNGPGAGAPGHATRQAVVWVPNRTRGTGQGSLHLAVTDEGPRHDDGDERSDLAASENAAAPMHTTISEPWEPRRRLMAPRGTASTAPLWRRKGVAEGYSRAGQGTPVRQELEYRELA